MLDLSPFRTAPTLLWHRHTVFGPHGRDDGTLMTGDGHRLPLDTWLPEDMKVLNAPAVPISDNGVGIVVIDPETIDDVHRAVTAWCLHNLGRNDIGFPD